MEEGAWWIPKQGAVILSIRLTGGTQEFGCKLDGIKRMMLRAEFLRK